MKRMKQAIALVMLVTSLLVPTSLKAQENRLKIVTSFYPMYALTKQVVGDIHQVKMINSGNGIHGFEPSVADVAAIAEADIFIYHSSILESWAKKLKQTLKDKDVRMVEASEGLDMDKVAGLEEVEAIGGMSESSMYDPHTWLDPLEVANEIQLIADQLSEIDPDHASDYQANAQAFTQEAQALVEEYQPKFEALSNKTFVTQHTAFSYLAKRFGLNQLGISGVSSDIEPGSKQLLKVNQFVEDNGVQTIFVEPNVSPKAAELVANTTGAKIETLSPLESDPQNTKTFIENLHETIETLYQGLQS
ncbi:metal ABC transporter solute-binding protein, Zn/Mn family [Facklamia languida]